MPSIKPSSGDWWQEPLADFTRPAQRYLRRRFPSLGYLHDDLLGDALFDLTALLTGRYAESLAAPTDDERLKRFHRLAYTILDRRVADHFRQLYRQNTQHIDDVPEEQLPSSGDPDAGARLDARRAVDVLVALLDEMSPEDRLLVTGAEMRDERAPRSDRDRQRLRRLRQQLTEKLRARLGEEALTLLRQIQA
jgi:hypothetical protein